MFLSGAELILLGILTVATYSLVGLLAIWAGLGRPHWFLRVAVVGGTLLLPLLIPAYEPVLLLSVQSAVVIVPLMLLKALRGRIQMVGSDAGSECVASARVRPQFSLLDLLLLTVVVAAIVAVAVSVPPDLWNFWTYVRATLYPFSLVFGRPIAPAAGWAAFGLCGLGWGISTLAAAWVVLGRSRLWLRLIVLCLVPTSAVMAVWLALVRASGWLPRSASRASSPATASPAGGATRPRVRRLAKLAAVLLSLLILIPPAAAFCVLVAPAPDPPHTVLPDPNGYHDLLKAAKALEGVTVPDADTATRQQLQAFLTRYGPVLDTARTGLNRECVVPLKYSFSDLDNSMDTVEGFRELGRAFRAEGKLAEMNGRPADAVGSYLDAIRLGHAKARGSLYIDWMVGRALEGIGVDALSELREMLTPKQCNELIDALQTLDADREPPEDVWARDQLWGRIAYDWKDQLTGTLMTITGSDWNAEAAMQGAALRCQATLRLLICGLALRRYCVENGNPPEKLADLVPDYLPEVPRDPYSGKPLVYRRNATGYLLYSVGPDGRDDGGEPMDEFYESGDFLLDKPPEAP